MAENQLEGWLAAKNSLGLDSEAVNRFPRWVLQSHARGLGVQVKGEGSQELHGGADWVIFAGGEDGKWQARPLDGAARMERGNLEDWRGVEFGSELLEEPKRRAAELGMTGEDCACPVLLVHDVFDALAVSESYAADFGAVAEVWPMCLKGSMQEVAARLKAAHVTQVLVLDAQERVALRRAGLDAELVAFESSNDLWRAMQDEAERKRFGNAVCKAYHQIGAADTEGVTLEESDAAFGVFGDWQEPIPTGFGALDAELNGGLAAGRVYLLAAAPSVGKSLFGLQITVQAAESGANVAYFSTEMSAQELYARLVSRGVHKAICEAERGIYENSGRQSVPVTAYVAARRSASEFGLLQRPHTDPQGGNFTWSSVLGSGVTESELLFKSSLERVQAGPLAGRIAAARRELLALKGRIRFFENDVDGGMTLGTIERTMRWLVARFGRRWLVIVDYVGMLQTDDRRMTDAQKAASIALGLKSLARKMQIPVFAVSATSRTNYGQMGMSTAKDSGVAEYAADVVMNLNFVRVVQKGDDAGAKGKAKESDSEAYRRRDRTARRLDEHTHARIVTVDVAKNRNGRTSNYVEFMQWPQYSDLLELGLRESDY